MSSRYSIDQQQGDPSSTTATPQTLADDALLLIFQFLAREFGPEAQAASAQAAGKGFLWFRRTLPLVCRRWNLLLAGGGKYPWSSMVISVEHECLSRRKRPETSSSAPASGPLSPGTSTAPVPGSSPTTGASMLMFMRPSLGSSLVKLRSSQVVAWTEARSGAVQHLLLDFGSPNHDFTGGHALEALTRAANRGPRGLQTLRLNASGGVGGQDSFEMLARLRGLVELHVTGLPQNFLSGTLPYLSSLSCLTRLSFTPEGFQFPIAVRSLPPNLQALTLSKVWLQSLPDIGSVAPQLRELDLLRCYLVEGLVGAMAQAPRLASLRLDGSSFTDATGSLVGWEVGRQWPACQGVRALSLAGCGLKSLPPWTLAAFPQLEALDLSNNPDLGGASAGVPDASAAGAALACLPPDLTRLSALAEVRLAGCGLTAVPAALLRIPSITALDFSTNSLSALPLPLPPPPLPPLSASGPAAAAAAAARPLPASPGSGASSLVAVAAGAGPGVALFADRLVRLNIALNRFTVWPQGLQACSSLQELVLGAPLVARAAEGDLERCVRALPALRRLEVRGASFEPRAVRSLLALQRMALANGRLVVEVTGV